jgi:Cu/Ag efflux protein CusF
MKIYRIVILASLLGAPTWALPAEVHASAATRPSGQQGKVHTGEGTVNSVNASKGEININHGPIPSLKWPSMTMDFPVEDPKLLDKVQKGDKVRFGLQKEGNVYQIVDMKVLGR